MYGGGGETDARDCGGDGDGGGEGEGGGGDGGGGAGAGGGGSAGGSAGGSVGGSEEKGGRREDEGRVGAEKGPWGGMVRITGGGDKEVWVGGMAVADGVGEREGGRGRVVGVPEGGEGGWL